jgi:hypothetical protein
MKKSASCFHQLILLALLLLSAAWLSLAGAPGVIRSAAPDSAAPHSVYLPLNASPFSLSINEWMSSNGQTVADEDGDFPDWIELHNYGSKPLSLSGIGLSDNEGRPFRWVLPDIQIAPGDYLLVWASGKNRALPGSPLHTNFSISAAGEPLLLTHPEHGRLDYVPPHPVPRDISRSRIPDGTGPWLYADQPTPGAANHTPGYDDLLPPPTFSHNGGFFTAEFDLALATDAAGATIIYTLDGSIPDPANLNGRTWFYKNSYPQSPGDPFGELLAETFRTSLYDRPIRITNRSAQPDKLTGKLTTFERHPVFFPENPVFKGVVVRARTIREGALPSATETHTFFVTPQGGARYPLPVISLAIQEDALFDYNDGIYVAGRLFDGWRETYPNAEAHLWSTANWHRRGDDTEFPVHIELFEPNQPEAALRQNAGWRLHGGATRTFPMKSLRLYARSGYGAGSFAYPLFPDQPDSSYARFVLRNSGNDFHRTMFRDAAIHRIVQHLPFDTQASRPAVVFINGEFWGIHNMRERYDDNYLARVYGVDPEQIDLLELYGVVVEGDAAHYHATLEYIAQNGTASAAAFAWLQTRIDMNNYRDYQIAQIFMGNPDWPQNNIKYWRLRTPEYRPDAPYGSDGRWRWLLYDTDYGLGNWSVHFNTLEWASTPRYWGVNEAGVPGEKGLLLPRKLHPSDQPHRLFLPLMLQDHDAGDINYWGDGAFLFRRLLENSGFRTDFITRFADLMNTTFLPERITGIVREMQQEILPVMPEHIARWRVPVSMTLWEQYVEAAIDFANQRPAIQRGHIRDKFNLPGDFTLTVDVSDPDQGYVRLNTIDLTGNTPGVAVQPYPWTGIYFQTVPVTLAAIAAPGHIFVRWDGLPPGTPHQAEMTFTADTSVRAVFAPAASTAGGSP